MNLNTPLSGAKVEKEALLRDVPSAIISCSVSPNVHNFFGGGGSLWEGDEVQLS
jgi:hypothetical protein